jgi:hypothetical protein
MLMASSKLMPRVLAIEELIFADLAGAGFVLGPAGGVAHLDVRHRVRAAFVAQQQAVALRVIPRVGRAFENLHQAAIGVLPECRR